MGNQPTFLKRARDSAQNPWQRIIICFPYPCSDCGLCCVSHVTREGPSASYGCAEQPPLLTPQKPSSGSGCQGTRQKFLWKFPKPNSQTETPEKDGFGPKLYRLLTRQTELTL